MSSEIVAKGANGGRYRAKNLNNRRFHGPGLVHSLQHSITHRSRVRVSVVSVVSVLTVGLASSARISALDVLVEHRATESAGKEGTGNNIITSKHLDVLSAPAAQGILEQGRCWLNATEACVCVCELSDFSYFLFLYLLAEAFVGLRLCTFQKTTLSNNGGKVEYE